MKKLRNLIFLGMLMATAISCEKHVIKYDSTDVSGQAEFQLHYFVPLTSGSENDIYKVEINGELYSNSKSRLYTYNAIPSGAVGKFFATEVGENNIKLYKGPDLELVYDQTCVLEQGKQNIFVYDFSKPPIIIDNGFPYKSIVTDSTADFAWVKFYNFLFEKEGEPTTLKLQYQSQYTVDYDTGEKSEWANVGEPLSFGEATGWELVHVNKTDKISSGHGRHDYRIKMIGQNGEDLGELQVLNSRDVFVDYSDYWNAYVGRRYHHILSGMRTEDPNCRVRQFTAL